MIKIIIKIIKAYQFFSKKIGIYNFFPVFLMPSCKFHPTCSEYSIMAIEKFGTSKGLVKSIIRFLRCNPFTSIKIEYP